MEENKARPTTIDEYIAQYPEDVQAIMTRIRAVIKESAPEAVEKISYQMPAFAQHGNLVYFASLKNHIGFYPTGSGITAFQAELAGYESSPGAVKFPVDQPLPLDLITRIVQFRVAANLENAAAKAGKKKAPAGK